MDIVRRRGAGLSEIPHAKLREEATLGGGSASLQTMGVSPQADERGNR